MCIALFWVFVTVRLFARRSGPVGLILLWGTTAALCLVSLVIDARAQISQEPGGVVGAEVGARKGDRPLGASSES